MNLRKIDRQAQQGGGGEDGRAGGVVAVPERDVGAAHPVVAARELGVGEQSAHVARPAQAELAPRDEEVAA